MKIRDMRDKEVLARQYRDSSNLEIRKNFHKKYGTDPGKYGDWILSNIGFYPGCRVLEVGCGTGDLWERHPQIVDTFSELVLTDISPGMVEIATERYSGRKNIRLQVMDVLDIPFEAGSFDIIVANSMLYLVSNVDLALGNCRRVLRQGGVFCATTFGKDGQLNYIHKALFELGLSDSEKTADISFSLENGRDILCRYFSPVRLKPYDAPLEVTEPADLVEYIFSMASMSHLDRSNRARLLAYFGSKKDSHGILTIPQKYGLYISVK